MASARGCCAPLREAFGLCAPSSVTISVMLAVAVLIAMTWSTIAEPGTNELEQNTDRPGSDYSFFSVPSADPEACLKACMVDENCKSFTLVRAGVQGPDARCFLKHSVSPPVADSCCVSGVRRHAR
jgi:hypothetical protein